MYFILFAKFVKLLIQTVHLQLQEKWFVEALKTIFYIPVDNRNYAEPKYLQHKDVWIYVNVLFLQFLVIYEGHS